MREQLQGQHLSAQTRGWFGVGLQSTRPDGQTMTKQQVLKAEGALCTVLTQPFGYLPVSSCSEKEKTIKQIHSLSQVQIVLFFCWKGFILTQALHSFFPVS